MPIHDQDVVLFQGDSITDAGRVRDTANASEPERLGRGYALLAAARLRADHPGLVVHNRGISGNRIGDLRDRWDADCLQLRPTVVSILIGVNDTWHGIAKGTPENGTDLETFDRAYRALLEQTRAALPGVKLVIGEPFTLECGAVLEMNFHPDIDERANLVRIIAQEYADAYVPYQAAYDRALQRHADPAYWAGDGVHPSLAGHQIMADAWQDAVRGI